MFNWFAPFRNYSWNKNFTVIFSSTLRNESGYLSDSLLNYYFNFFLYTVKVFLLPQVLVRVIGKQNDNMKTMKYKAMTFLDTTVSQKVLKAI